MGSKDIRQKLVKCIEHLEHDNFAYLVTRAHQFGTLDTYLAARNLPTGSCQTQLELQPLARSIIAAIASMHDLGFLHNDIHPSNIFLVPSQQGSSYPANIKLGGFGCATFIKAKSADSVREQTTQAACQDPYEAELSTHLLYCAPEVLRDSSLRSTASDVWSLGVTLYTLACGQVPFKSPD